jgi:integrase
MGSLTARAVLAHKKPGTVSDGDGLYLQVAKAGSKSWIMRYQRGGRRRELGLGGFPAVPLAEARERAIEVRRQLAAGTDPIEARRAERAKAATETAKAITFEECARRYITAHKAGWRSPKSLIAWESTLIAYVYPHFGAVPVEAIDVGVVLNALEPIWTAKSETASRVRGRIESIIDWAKARGYRTGENPARWRGHLDQLLAPPRKVRRVAHLAALDYRDVAAFMAELREQGGIGARALEFAILTAGRTGEVIGARWSEINVADKLWTIPAGRMKAGKEHRVPLSDAAMAVLDRIREVRLSSEFVFGASERRAISNMSMLMLLRRMGRGDLTVHGFRSTFRDWAAEMTAFPHEVAEMALSHTVTDKVERAYRRGDLFQKRRALAEAWAAYCARPLAPAEILPIRSRRA